MRKHWFMITAMIILQTLVGLSTVAQDHRGPKLVLKEKEFDFKDVKEGEVLEHTFRVFNEGDQKLVIKSVRPG